MTTQALSGGAAKELGRALRFIRQARGLSLRDVAQQAPMSPQYLQNIERGERTAASMEVYDKLQHVYELPDNALADLLLRARIMSALDDRGITHAHSLVAWGCVETELQKLRYPIRTDLAELVAAIIR